MIFHAPIMAMLLASVLSAVTILWASGFAVQAIRHWDIASGSRRQLMMERRTYLVSTALVFVLLLELASLLLFVFNADKMAVMFVGAMCAVGTLNVNAYGFPALMVKITLFFAAAVWLIVHHVDGKGRDYPLTRFKYAFLILLAPVVIAEAALQLAYFLNLRADVITSCCSKLFTPESKGLEAELAGIDPTQALYLLLGALAGTAVLALFYRQTGRGAVAYGVGSGLFFIAGITAVVSVLASYIYEHPHHHCPFCILKPEYGYIGYWLYIPLFAGTAFGIASGVLSLHPLPDSLREQLPTTIRRNIAASLSSFTLFGLIALWVIARSNLILFG